MKVIITEKNNAARRIAEILSDGTATVESRYDTTVYAWDDVRCIGLSGHVVGVDFPNEYSDWRDVEPVELIDAPIRTRVTRPDIVNTVKEISRTADHVIIATDYDREGELIGKEAHDIVRDVAPDIPIDRVRFSSITEREVRTAFEELDDIDFDLAAAGEARQIVDLIWGAALTRFLSLAAGRLGDDFISVGRVQSPTLKLIVDREREIEAFDPETYWELFADLSKGDEAFEAQYFYLDEDENEADRVWDAEHAQDVFEAIESSTEASVTSVSKRTRTDTPPAPFNTTQFIRAAGSLGFTAQRAMSIAEDLYTAGYITYPRTDNTVYPDDLDPAGLLESLAENESFGDDAQMLAKADSIDPTEGDEETTDHPPIHPTSELPDRDALSDREWRIYELVVRRFFATVAEPAIWNHLRVVATVSDHQFKANGKRLTQPGYHAVYPYFNTDENIVPMVEEGETLTVTKTDIAEKETQPPRRYGQSRLIERMEQLGVGTKSTRHHTIEKLYDRGYLEDDPPRPTQLANAVVEAAKSYAEQVTSESMTAQLEADMTAIAEGEADLTDVTDESRTMLEEIFADLMESHEDIGQHIQDSLRRDRTVGPCPDCGEDLLVRQNRYGSSFIGCDGYPDCEYTLPLPSGGKPLLLDDRCDDHDMRKIKLLAGRQTRVHGCPQCKADEADATEDREIGACPECGESEGGSLAIKRLRNGSRLAGCTRYPECEYSLPLPRRGEIEITDATCDIHDLPELVVHSGDEPWELGCPICNFEEYQAENEKPTGLESLSGLGAKTKEKFVDAGIETLEDLQDGDPESLAEAVDGVSVDRITEWQEAIE